MSQGGFVIIYRQKDDKLIKAIIDCKRSCSFSTSAKLASLAAQWVQSGQCKMSIQKAQFSSLIH